MQTPPTHEEYCRDIETYLCRKNDGHLIRIVGPSFERVYGWAARGIPLRIAQQGIDRYFARYYAKGPRRRPVQIDFCDADVLDAFDDWRRAVGVVANGSAGVDEAKTPRRSLRAHLNRVLERLSSLLTASTPIPEPLRAVLESTADEISTFVDLAAPIRGESRARVSDRLAALDRALLAALRESTDPASLAELLHEAQSELAPFRERMPPAVYEEAVNNAVDRLLRERTNLPVVSFG